jgi:diacylglycerol kinase (ATP)
MRAAAIFGPGTSPADLKPFQSNSQTTWQHELPTTTADADAILVFGGDGTIHRHLAALVRLQLPVLIVPSGSGNDFARAIKLRSMRDSLRAWRNFESGKSKAQAVDLGVIVPFASPAQKHFFCCVAGCGLDSAVSRQANRMPRWLRGHGGYVVALLPLLFKLPAFSVKLTQYNGERSGPARSESAKSKPANTDARNARPLTLLAAFANTQFFGDGMRIAPQADFTDGKLDICRISTMNPFQLFCMFPTVYSGHHLLSSKVDYSKSKRVRLETDPPLDIYADGEFVCQTPAEISIAASALQLIGPT